MVFSAQRLEMRNGLESDFFFFHAFLITSTLIMLCLRWIGSPALPVWLQKWKGGSWSWGCFVPCRTEGKISISYSVGWQLFPLRVVFRCSGFHTVSHRPLGFWWLLLKGFQDGIIKPKTFKFTIQGSVFPLENYERSTSQKKLKSTDMHNGIKLCKEVVKNSGLKAFDELPNTRYSHDSAQNNLR